MYQSQINFWATRRKVHNRQLKADTRKRDILGFIRRQCSNYWLLSRNVLSVEWNRVDCVSFPVAGRCRQRVVPLSITTAPQTASTQLACKHLVVKLTLRVIEDNSIHRRGHRCLVLGNVACVDFTVSKL